MTRFVLSFATCLVLAGTAAASAAETPPFRAQGNEPSWSITATPDGMNFTTMDGTMVMVSPAPEARLDGNTEIYEATVADEAFVLTIADTVCSDTMSGMPFPKSVTVKVGDKTFSGCGGEPAALLSGEWIVAEVDGKAAVAGSPATLNFDADGKLNGNATCNRFFGSYTLTGEGLTIGEMGSSMMACEPPLMEQEMAILDLLKWVSRFEIAEDGALILHSGTDRTLTAHRTG